MYVPHSARLDCVNCSERYDFRVMPDSSCPECGCPPATIRDDSLGGRGATIPNPAQATWLASKGTATRPAAEASSKADRAEYMRAYMAKRRQLERDSARPSE